jgi:hypothetical protein
MRRLRALQVAWLLGLFFPPSDEPARRQNVAMLGARGAGIGPHANCHSAL